MSQKAIAKIDLRNSSDAVDLSGVLNVFERYKDVFTWTILDLEARCKPSDSGEPILLLEKRINSAENGIVFSWNELMALSKRVSQVIDVVIVGCSDRGKAPRFGPDTDLFLLCDVVIEVLDSTVWRIATQNEELIMKILEKYPAAKME